MKNPYEEGSTNAMNWQAGFDAQSDSECPYEKDDTDSKDYYHAWMKGYRASKKKSGKTKEEKAPLVAPELESFTTEQLEVALRTRKQSELEKLLKQKAELDHKIFKLQALFGE